MPDAPELFAGTDPADRTSVPLTSARRLAVLQWTLAEDGVDVVGS